ncbi:MAG: lipopolysaccharide biosynthesis protein [Eubacteriales bacterium]|nr:lipopolysaccharide biosynthesis protein [Eubacteriales bacterium]
MDRITERWAEFLLKTGPDREKQNMIWNMIGSFCYAFASMVLAFLVMRMIGEEQGGIFAFGYSTLGQQMFIVAYFGIRPFQITDGGREYRFGDYLHHRYATCGLALFAGAGYVLISGYSAGKAAVIFLLVCYKVIDGFADVYESEFQRNGFLYLTGKSNTFRTVLTVAVFLICLAAGRDLTAACLAAVAAQLAGISLFDLAVIRKIPGVDFRWKRYQMKPLTRATALLFVSVFLDFYIFSASKYAIDGCMDDAASGYFNMIFMPTSVINLAAGFVIRPVLTGLTAFWNEGRISDFTGKMLRISRIIGLLSLLAFVLVVSLGKPVLWVLERLLGAAYDGKLTVYYTSFILIVMGGACYALLNLHYYALVIMRRQRVIFGIYVVLAAAAAVTAPWFVSRWGIWGAALSYLILMAAMTAGFVWFTWAGVIKEGRRIRQKGAGA